MYMPTSIPLSISLPWAFQSDSGARPSWWIPASLDAAARCRPAPRGEGGGVDLCPHPITLKEPSSTHVKTLHGGSIYCRDYIGSLRKGRYARLYIKSVTMRHVFTRTHVCFCLYIYK